MTCELKTKNYMKQKQKYCDFKRVAQKKQFKHK